MGLQKVSSIDRHRLCWTLRNSNHLTLKLSPIREKTTFCARDHFSDILNKICFSWASQSRGIQIQIGPQRWVRILFPPSSLIFNSPHEVRQTTIITTATPTAAYKREVFLMAQRKMYSARARSWLCILAAEDLWLGCRQRRGPFPLLSSRGPRVGYCSISSLREWWGCPRRQASLRVWTVVSWIYCFFAVWFTLLPAPMNEFRCESNPGLAASRTCHVHSCLWAFALAFVWCALPVIVCGYSVTQSCLTLANLQTIAHHAPLSMGFSQQEYWIGLPFPLPGDLPHPEIKPSSPVAPALAGRLFRTEPPGKPPVTVDQFKTCSSHMAKL